MGGKSVVSPGSSGNRAWNLGWEGGRAGLLDSHLPSCTQDQKRGMGCSSGQDPGPPGPQSRTGAQRAPNPGAVKLAAGKKELHPRIPSVVGAVPSLLGCQAVKTPNAGALSGPWGTARLPPPTGSEVAPEVGQVGRGLMGVWPECPGPQPPTWAPDPQGPPNISLTKGPPLAHLPNLQEEGIGPHLGSASLSAPVLMKTTLQSIC